MTRWLLFAAFPGLLVAGVSDVTPAKAGALPQMTPVLAVAPTTGPHIGSHGSTVIATRHGPLVVERNAGAVVRADREGNPLHQLDLNPGLGEIVHDGHDLIFVADRQGDRIVRVDAGDDDAGELSIASSASVREPYGLALTPDGKTLLATSVANHELVAFDTKTLKIRWRAELGPEPRGVAIDRKGTRAVVGFLSRGALASVDLASEGSKVRWHALDPRDHIRVEEEVFEHFEETNAVVREAPSRFRVPTSTGRRYSRNAFAVGFLASDQVVTAYEVAVPQLVRDPNEEEPSSYGGVVSIPPLSHRVALIANAGSPNARLSNSFVGVHQPRALAYDLERDTLFVGGYGDDAVVAISHVSQPAPVTSWHVTLTKVRTGCGIDGMVADAGTLWIHCELTRRLVRIGLDKAAADGSVAEWETGPELAATLRSPEVERGAELFRRANDHRLSDAGTLACASCHPEGRADGLTWRLGDSILQTPMLAGRVVGTAPYKWDGQDKTIRDSIRHTIGRLGGCSDCISRKDIRALQAFVESLPAPQTKDVASDEAVERGRELFVGAELDCGSCHEGEKLTDGGQYPLQGVLETSDTPSLVGLGQSAPYYHDGSAPDLRTLVTDRGSIHDMADLSGLSAPQVSDLTAYLESL